MFGVSQQVSRAGRCYQSDDGSVTQLPDCEPRSPNGLTLPVFLWRCAMLTGFAAFLVITYIRKFCRKKNPSAEVLSQDL